ncbi:TPA: hypothetical protein G8O67_003132 [Salmonella enterica]|uniref:Uncharacterized protein n=1 Tax=Salmonella enterica TaxID=28901 RepID=A0A756L955_SALER|nr:hypothetical protein [Salmonella enterica]
MTTDKQTLRKAADIGGIIRRFQHLCDQLSDRSHIDEHSCLVDRRDLMTVTEYLNPVAERFPGERTMTVLNKTRTGRLEDSKLAEMTNPGDFFVSGMDIVAMAREIGGQEDNRQQLRQFARNVLSLANAGEVSRG